MNALPSYSSARKRKTLRGLTPQRALDTVAVLTDGSEESGDVQGLRRAVGFCAQLRGRKWSKRLTAEQHCLVHYYEANAWSALAHLTSPELDAQWRWDHPEALKQLLCLRRATRSEGFGSIGSYRRCQVHTNTANTLNWLGRTVEAFVHWDHALTIDPTFSMALGNRGVGLVTYARHIHDDGHQILILREARDSLAAVDLTEVHPAAQAAFTSKLQEVEGHLGKADRGIEVEWDRPSLGRSKRERAYRRWCLDQCLFINPLNDVWRRPLVAHDVTFLPSLWTAPGEGMPAVVGAFNGLKQEYASARLLLYEGLEQERPHFSDRGVRLIDTQDYPSYGLGREQVKAAFRMAYSILDKIGFVVNEYFSLGTKPKDVSFRLLWYADQDPRRGLRTEFASRRNLPLRGLHWISRDLFDASSGLNATADPDARDLQLIRNHIEHRYLKVHDAEWAGPDDTTGFTDRLAYSIRREDFEQKALRMMKLARAGLIHLVLAIYAEEARRASERDSSPGVTLPMMLQDLDERRKV